MLRWRSAFQILMPDLHLRDMFDCDRCGLCCRNVWMNETYRSLDRGDGVCRYLQEDNLCSIYEQRPLLCRIDYCYEAYYSEEMTREEFYKLNQYVCETLKTEEYVPKKTQ